MVVAGVAARDHRAALHEGRRGQQRLQREVPVGMALVGVADLQGEGVVERLGQDLQPDRGRVRPEAAGGLVAAVGYDGTTAVMGGLVLGVALWCSRGAGAAWFGGAGGRAAQRSGICAVSTARDAGADDRLTVVATTRRL